MYMTTTQTTRTNNALFFFRPAYRYSVRRSSDANIVRTWTVISRTAKFITVLDDYGKTKRCAITNNDGIEIAYPDGTYAWAPMISADRHV
jgi:hypothetical protein